MMKILLLDGTSESNQLTLDIIESFRVIADNISSQVEVVTLREKSIAPCRGCFGCWIKTPGECIMHDDAPEITAKIINSDVIVYLTPIIFGTCSPILKVLQDRSISLIHPFFQKIKGEYHHRKRYKNYPHIVGIGLLESADDELEGLYRRNIARVSINMHALSSKCHIVYSDAIRGSVNTDIENILSSIEVFA